MVELRKIFIRKSVIGFTTGNEFHKSTEKPDEVKSVCDPKMAQNLLLYLVKTPSPYSSTTSGGVGF